MTATNPIDPGRHRLTKRAIVIGVGRSTMGEEPLRSAERDADRVRKLLRGERADVELSPDQPWSVYTVIASDDIDPQTGKQVGSKDHLTAAFGMWWQSSHREDPDNLHLLIYFAGHATPVAGGEVVLLAVDDQWMSLSELAERMIKSTARNVTVILDCCHAAELNEQLWSRLAIPATSRSTRGRAVLAACAADKASYAFGDVGGLFTTVVLNGLGADPTVRGKVSARSLVDYVAEKWPTAMPTYAEGQEPALMTTFQIGDDIPLVEIRRSAAEPRPLAVGSAPRKIEAATSVEGPLGNIRAERTSGGVRILEVARATGELHPWPGQVNLAPSERLLAITTSLDGSTAWLAVSDQGGTHVVRVRRRNGAQRYAVDGVAAATRGRFGGAGERDLLVLETASGAEQHVRVRTLRPLEGTGTPA